MEEICRKMDKVIIVACTNKTKVLLSCMCVKLPIILLSILFVYVFFFGFVFCSLSCASNIYNYFLEKMLLFMCLLNNINMTFLWLFVVYHQRWYYYGDKRNITQLYWRESFLLRLFIISRDSIYDKRRLHSTLLLGTQVLYTCICLPGANFTQLLSWNLLT